MGSKIDDALIRALLEPEAYPHETDDIRLVTTHISWLLLTGPYAYKIKKPLTLSFLDFSTLELRRKFCEEELRLNRRLAPDLYLEVSAIGGSRERPRIGTGPAIEYAVKMKQFPLDATLDRQLALGHIARPAIHALAEAIAAFHEGLSPSGDAVLGDTALANLDELERSLDGSRRSALAELATWTRAELERIGEVLMERHARGAIRECHGDLHLENLAYVDGRILPFDALEFDRKLRSIDVVDEAAFTAMDLIAHERDDLAYEFLNRYFECTGDYTGLRVLKHYLVKRALVCAKVHVIKAEQTRDPDQLARVDRYLATAKRMIEPRTPLLIITRGLSGSGKTTVSDALVPRLTAIRVRSDLERKRLHRLEERERSGSAVAAGLYDRAGNERTYGRLEEAAAAGLEGGCNVIVDAAFLSQPRRVAMRSLAARHRARFAILDCRAPEATLRQRIAEREASRRDASEASNEVLDYQLQHADPLGDDEQRRCLAVATDAAVDYDALARRLLTFETLAQ